MEQTWGLVLEFVLGALNLFRISYFEFRICLEFGACDLEFFLQGEDTLPH